ncbi:hypothetical protein [Pelagicoccus sp. SDUM812003]|uniref:hypothetical protein n=1 Tax=Pelagicoccus sp. SDUM812003 TaxID=3041267 RepID=UPI00280FCA67|nr:hypothetical protein [Pelagicoccus sp. SDUM812003]MDQ8201873.1 hypothetical protein [Pelagicoccus sp. SDUM812003]
MSSDLTLSERRQSILDAPLEVDFNSDLLKRLLLTDEPFETDCSLLELGTFRIDDSTKEVRLGGATSPLNLQLSGSAELVKRLYVVCEESGLEGSLTGQMDGEIDFDKQAILALEISGDGGLTADVASPVGAYFKGRGGMDSENAFHFFHCLAFDKTMPAREALSSFFSGLRWPLQSALDPETLQDGSVSGIGIRSNLELWGTAQAGYETRGSRSVDIQGLNPEFQYRVNVGASLAASCRLGGVFEICSRKGSEGGWARLQARRSRSRSFEGAGGLDINAGIKVEGLGRDPNRLLGALLGVNLDTALRWLEAISRCDSWSDAMGMLKARYGEQLGALAESFYENVLASKSYEALQGLSERVLVELKEFEGEADRRLLEVAQAGLAKGEALVEKIDSLVGSDAEMFLKRIEDEDTWDLIEIVLGEPLVGVVSDAKSLFDLRKRLGKLKEIVSEAGSFRGIRSYLKSVDQRLDVDGLVNRLSSLSSPSDFKLLMAGELGDLSRRVFDLAETELADPATFRRARQAAKALLGFRSQLAVELENGFARKLELSLSASYARRRSSDCILDIELDLRSEEGRGLYEECIKGNFRPALQAFREPYLKTHSGQFHRSLVDCRNLRLHVFGWGKECLCRASQVENSRIQNQGNGAVFLYDSKTALETRYKSGYGLKELTTTAYNLRAQAEALVGDAEGENADFFGPEILDLATDYRVMQEDDTPRWGELADYLRFAEQLGICESAELMADELYLEFADKTPSRFSLKYTVRYSPRAFSKVFLAYDDELEDLISQSFRQYFSDRYYASGRRFFSEASFESYMRHSRIDERSWSSRHRSGRKKYVVYDELGNSDVVPFGRELYHAYLAERRFKKALLRLDDIFDAIHEDGILERYRLDELNGALMELMSVSRKGRKGIWSENLFFLVLDSLQRAVDPNAREGMTVMELSLHFEDRESVRRLYAV